MNGLSLRQTGMPNIGYKGVGWMEGVRGVESGPRLAIIHIVGSGTLYWIAVGRLTWNWTLILAIVPNFEKLFSIVVISHQYNWLAHPPEKAVVGRGTSEGSYSSGHSAVWLATSNQDSHSNRPTLVVTFQQLCNSTHGSNNRVPVQLIWNSTHFPLNSQSVPYLFWSIGMLIEIDFWAILRVDSWQTRYLDG